MSDGKKTGDELRAKTNERVKKYRSKAATEGLCYVTVLVPVETAEALRAIAKKMTATHRGDRAKKAKQPKAGRPSPSRPQHSVDALMKTIGPLARKPFTDDDDW